MEIIIDKHCKKLKLQNFHYLITNMALQMNNYKKMKKFKKTYLNKFLNLKIKQNK